MFILYNVQLELKELFKFLSANTWLVVAVLMMLVNTSIMDLKILFLSVKHRVELV